MPETTTDRKAEFRKLAKGLHCPKCQEPRIRVSVRNLEATCGHCGDYIGPEAVLRVARRMVKLARALDALEKEINGR
jgi:hypothetical protein